MSKYHKVTSVYKDQTLTWYKLILVLKDYIAVLQSNNQAIRIML